jgi:hypothetical protein
LIRRDHLIMNFEINMKFFLKKIRYVNCPVLS